MSEIWEQLANYRKVKPLSDGSRLLLRPLEKGDREALIDLFGRAQAELERVLIDCALDQTAGQRQKAAELLGLGRNTLTRKLQKIDSERSDEEIRVDQAAGGV